MFSEFEVKRLRVLATCIWIKPFLGNKNKGNISLENKLFSICFKLNMDVSLLLLPGELKFSFVPFAKNSLQNYAPVYAISVSQYVRPHVTTRDPYDT